MSNDLNVLLSAYACRPNSGTEPGNGWNWAVHVARRGIRIHVLTVPEAREDIERFCVALPIPGLTFSYVEVPKRFRYTSRLHYVWWQWAAVKVARKVHHITPFDVAHHVTYSSIHVPTQLWRLGIPTIFGPVGGGQVTPFRMLPAFGAQWHSELLHRALTHSLSYSPFHRRWLQKMALILATNTDTLLLAKALANKQVEPWFDAALPLDFFTGRRASSRISKGPSACSG